MADEMVKLLEKQPGFLGFESAVQGEEKYGTRVLRCE